MGEDGFRDKAFMGRWGVLFENRRGPMESTEMDEESSATEVHLLRRFFVLSYGLILRLFLREVLLSKKF